MGAEATGGPCASSTSWTIGIGSSLLEQLQDSVFRATDHRSVAGHENRTLHQLRVREQQGDHGLGRPAVGCIEPEFLEILVLSDQVDRLVRKQADDSLQRGLVERLFDVFDDVELDVSLAQNFQRAARLASARVVV